MRSGVTYTVDISGGDGQPVPLSGAANPFTTDEDDDDDLFLTVRTQSGYIRVIDDGEFYWTDLVPETDVSRPVKLSHVENGNTITDWQGYLQAQNFSGTLYGNPQIRQFPIFCMLSALSTTEVDATERNMRNFAFIIYHAFNSLPGLDVDFFYFAGGEDTLSWLQKLVDWQNLVEEDSDGNIVSKYNNMEVIDDICRFWGWSVRCSKASVMFSHPDRADTYRKMTPAQLLELGNGNGTLTGIGTDESYTSVSVSGDVFASVDNEDTYVRGCSRAIVTADANTADDTVFAAFPETVEEQMDSMIWDSYIEDDMTYSTDLMQFSTPFVRGTARTGGSFNLARDIENTSYSVIRQRKTYDGTVLASIDMEFGHSYYAESDRFSILIQRRGLFITADILSEGVKYEDYDDRGRLKGSFIMHIGIGETRETALWYNEDAEWTSRQEEVVIQFNENNNRAFINTDSPGLRGRVFMDFLGSRDMPEVNGIRKFDIANMQLVFSETVKEWTTLTHSERKLSEKAVYYANNASKIRSEWDCDMIYASENNLQRGYGIVINPDGSRMEQVSIGGVQKHPEQHVADRVASYWRKSRRKIRTEMRSDTIPDIKPQNTAVIDSQPYTPIAISRDWWDDITKITFMEI